MSSLDAVEPTLLTKTRDNANESGSRCDILQNSKGNNGRTEGSVLVIPIQGGGMNKNEPGEGGYRS